MIAAASAAMAAITLRRGRERPGAGVGAARLDDAGGISKGEDESDGVPRSSFMQVLDAGECWLNGKLILHLRIFH